MIDKETVRNVAALARIHLEDRELEEQTDQLRKILEFFNTLKEVDTSKVDPAVHAVALKGPVRKDAVQSSMDRDKLMSNTNHSKEGFYVVPKVIS